MSETDFAKLDRDFQKAEDITPPNVVKTIPDFSKKVPTDIKEIRIVFSKRMKTDRMDILYPFLPVGRIRWDEDGKMLVIPIIRKLEPSKTYKLTLNGVDRYFTDLAGNQLEECILVFTTQGGPGIKPSVPDEKGATQDVVINITGTEELDLSDNLISSIDPLLNNLGIGEGDVVDLRNNPLNYEAYVVHIPALVSKGANILAESAYIVSFPDSNLEEIIREALDKPDVV